MTHIYLGDEAPDIHHLMNMTLDSTSMRHCDHWVMGSILTGAKLRNNLGQVVYTYSSVTKQYNLVPVKGR